MQSVEGAVIACAGLGSRLGMGLPKCLIEVDGKTILSRLIETLRPLVPRIHVVIGYREELVAEYCARYHRDVVLVRNPQFRETNTAFSILLGSLGFSSKVLYLDGDLIVEKESIAHFVRMAGKFPYLIGVTEAKSENAVLALIEGQGKKNVKVSAFGRNLDSRYEWANVFVGPPACLADASNYVFEVLEPSLPLPACFLQLHEVDTPSDLRAAELFLGSYDSGKE
ncbi:NTP transferase domain-containing protein [Marinobacter sp. NFXS9]|uniref:NTP transferase domain-containing protein n=1 Tax=Marinobacter sp. NFXS9 TaxID=2818433 RepID=UPI0032DFFAF1